MSVAAAASIEADRRGCFDDACNRLGESGRAGLWQTSHVIGDRLVAPAAPHRPAKEQDAATERHRSHQYQDDDDAGRTAGEIGVLGLGNRLDDRVAE